MSPVHRLCRGAGRRGYKVPRWRLGVHLGKMVVGSHASLGVRVRRVCLYKSGKGHRTEPLRVPVRGRGPGGNGEVRT